MMRFRFEIPKHFALDKWSILLVMLISSITLTAQKGAFEDHMKHVRYLSSDELKGRGTNSKEMALARKYIVRHMTSCKLTPYKGQYEHAFKFLHPIARDVLKGYNLIGEIKGMRHPDRYFVIGAHYDHLGVRSGEIYNGADDNASGVSGLLSLMDYFSKNKTRHSILFVAFDAEEWGLKGSRHLVEETVLPIDQIDFMLNLDMIGRNDCGELFVCGTRYTPELKRIARIAAKKISLSIIMGHDGETDEQDWTTSSDHGPFHEANIPFLYLGEEDHFDYHKPTDDWQKIQPEFLSSSIEYARNLIKYLDKKWQGILRKR